MREYGALLHLQPPVLDQALHLLAQAIPDLMGNWRRDNLSAAVVYAACRCITCGGVRKSSSGARGGGRQSSSTCPALPCSASSMVLLNCRQPASAPG